MYLYFDENKSFGKNLVECVNIFLLKGFVFKINLNFFNVMLVFKMRVFLIDNFINLYNYIDICIYKYI